MHTYRTGTSSNTIFVTADINTVGLAHTRGVVRKAEPGSPIISSATSKDASGDIHRADLGSAERCAGNMLVIATEISLITLPADEREDEFKRLSASYCLEGGTEGQVSYNAPDEKQASADFGVVVLRKLIQLTA